MSVIVVTDLIPGELATSADVNATLTSFVDGCGTGDLVAVNFRFEGLDRRSLPITGGLVEAQSQYYAGNTGSGAISSATYVVIPLGSGDMVTPAGITAPVTAMLLLHASVLVTKGAIAATATRSP